MHKFFLLFTSTSISFSFDKYLDFLSQNPLSLSMADQFYLCLIESMDHHWFQHIILFPEPTSLLLFKTLKPSISSTLSLSSPLDEEENSSPLEDEEKSSDSSPISMSLYNSNNEEDEEKEMNVKEQPTQLNLIRGRTRSLYFPPSTQKRPTNRRHSTSKLQKSRSLVDLELEEVKGFMDLGFIFNKEHLCPRMMSVVPGLQRANLFKNKVIDPEIIKKHDEIEEDRDYEKGIMRPYLSEAWLIKRPDSPLLNLKIPRVTAATDMKKHLRFWAKTVALTVQQEC